MVLKDDENKFETSKIRQNGTPGLSETAESPVVTHG